MPFRLAFCANVPNPFVEAVLATVTERLQGDPDIQLLEWGNSRCFPAAAIPYLKPDGILVAALTGEEIASLPAGTQVFGFSNYLDHTPYPRVVQDDRMVGRMAATALLKTGYAHWLLLDDQGTHFTHLRAQGMQDVATEHGIPYERLNLSMDTSVSGETFQEIWSKRVTTLEERLCSLEPNAGILTPSQAMAYEVLELLRESSPKSVPDELGLMVADMVRPGDAGLSSLRLDVEAVVDHLMTWVRMRLIDPAAVLPEVQTVPPLEICYGATLRSPSAG
jgi:hypothetical protein